MKKKEYRSYIFATLFLFVIIAILVENSYLLVKQTNKNITETSWLEAEKLINSIVASAKQSIETVHLTPQQINRHLKRVTQKVDNLFTSQSAQYEYDMGELLRQNKIESAVVLDAFGNAMATYEKSLQPYLENQTAPPDTTKNKSKSHFQPLTKQLNLEKLSSHVTRVEEVGFQILEFDRNRAPGTIRLIVGREKFKEIQARIGLQLLINSLENQNVIQSATFLNDQLLIIADYEPTRINITEEKLEYLDALTSGVSYFLRNEDTMEIIHPIQLTQDLNGVFRIAFRLPGIDQIYSNALRITIINSVIITLAAIFAAIIVAKLYRRNLSKINAMERQIRENEKLSSLANLTAGVAHEVRNPLNSISITIQRLQLEFLPSRKKDRLEYAELTDMMKSEVDRINTIITDYIDFAKPFQPQMVQFSITDFLENNLKIIKPVATQKGVNLRLIETEQGRYFLGDQEKLTQVLINLLSNALDATPIGGTIVVRSRFDKNINWVLKVIDNGSGIATSNLNHVFDIYFTTKNEGSGLGLYISRKIVHAHGGVIELAPNLKEGITVKIVLPNRDTDDLASLPV